MEMNHNPSVETTCGFLLLDLQKLWDEVGLKDDERDQILFEIEQECLLVYKSKVNQASDYRSQLYRQISLSQSEISTICSALGDPNVNDEDKLDNLSLLEKLQIINPKLEEIRKRKAERKKQFNDLVRELRVISKEIFGSTNNNNLFDIVVDDDEADLSLKRLVELQNQLQEFHIEKSNRLRQVSGLVESLKSLCNVLDMDFKHAVSNIDANFNILDGLKDITDGTIKKLNAAIQSLEDVKMQRIKKLQELGSVLLELWELMGIPTEEKMMFQDVINCVLAAECDITVPNVLSMDLINRIEDEVSRLQQLKSIKVKELLVKKRLELEEVCRSTHLVTDAFDASEFSFEAVKSGPGDPVQLLGAIELDIAQVKEEAFSRKEILDKVEKWLAACEEECWLEDYNRDENRYNAGRGAHLTLKRAEKARTLVSKIPAMVEALTVKTNVWETERGTQFFYDGRRLLSMLEDYILLRKEKEQVKMRQRDEKKRQVQKITEQEALFGAKPSPLKSVRKPSGTSIGGGNNRKLSLGGAMLQNFRVERASTPFLHTNKIHDSINQNSSFRCEQYSSFASQNIGRRTSEIGGHFVKKQSSAKIYQSQSQVMRKPLSPIPFRISSSKTNIVNFLEDQKETETEKTTLAADPCSKTPIRTPTKTIISGGNGFTTTPKTAPILGTTTPITVPSPMLVASTPATPYVYSAANTSQEVEYSFEEIRAGILYPKVQSLKMVQV